MNARHKRWSWLLVRVALALVLALPAYQRTQAVASSVSRAETVPAAPVLASLSQAPAATSDAWPMLGHDAGASNANPAAGISVEAAPHLHVIWQRTGSVPVAVVGRTLYAIDQKNAYPGASTAVALDAATGRLLYRYPWPGVGGITVAAGRVYLNFGSEIRIVDGRTNALIATATGDRGGAYRTCPGPQQIAHAVFQEVIAALGDLYAVSFTQNCGYRFGVYAFDGQSGHQLWSTRDIVPSPLCLCGKFLTYRVAGNSIGDAYFRSPRSGALVRTDRGIGTAPWHAAGTRIYADDYADVIVRGQGIPRFSNEVQAYNQGGKLLWSARNTRFLAALPDRVLVLKLGTVASSSAPGIEALAAADGHILWQTAVTGLGPNDRSQQGIVAGSIVVVIRPGTSPASLLDTGSGRLLGTLPFAQAGQSFPFALAGAYQDQILAADGRLYTSVEPALSPAYSASQTLVAYGS